MNSTNNRMLVKNCLASALGLLVCLFRYLTDKSTYLNDSFFFFEKENKVVYGTNKPVVPT